MRETLKTVLWPAVALLVLLAFNFFANPNFFHLEIVEGRISGSLVDVLERAAPVVLLSLGMTLVIATGGVDLSVGAVMAMSGALAAVLLSQTEASLTVLLLAALGVAAVAGAWNGFLVSVIGIQPIVATLILMVAGRGIAQLMTDGQIITVRGSEGFSYIGGGTLFGLPFSVTIVASAVIATAMLTRWTAMGLFIESVGGNEIASRYAGLNVRWIRFLVYTFCGLCSGLAGIIYASDITAADSNNAGLYLELDAILAVVIGGTALTGGRFYLLGSVLGALIIQTLATTILMTKIGDKDIPTEYNLIVKAIVVLVVCLLQSAALRGMVLRKAVDT
ncbi:MAG TPA: ABC transporter permease [Pirellulales bacterium]|nr:ABC transporter permease [Pirellulales bacterium]